MPTILSDTMTIEAAGSLTTLGGMDSYPGVIDLRSLKGLDIYVPASFQGDLAFYVSNEPDGTFAAKYDYDDALLEITVTPERWYIAPPELFSANFVKLFSHNAGVAQAQSADRELLVMGKY